MKAIAGVALVTLVLLVVVLEGGYAGYHMVRTAAWGKHDWFDSAAHPFWNQPWFAGRLHRMNQLATSVVYDPYRGWRLRKVSRPDMNVDAAGVRLTTSPAEAVQPARKVLMLGGSTMWGFSARDPFTIPSLVAERLAARGLTDVQVVNLASIGYNVTQGASTLLLQLRRGEVPAAVVSLDGINEVGLVYEGGNPGEIYQQARAERHFDHTSFLQDLAYLRIHLPATMYAEAIVKHRLGLTPAPQERDPDKLCAEISSYYVRVTRAMEAEAREFGFPIFFLTTPTLARSRKPRSKWEASIQNTAKPLPELTVRCGAMADSLMGSRRGATYFPLDSLFDRDTASVFIDHFGHVTEEANGAIADRITELLLPRLQPRSH